MRNGRDLGERHMKNESGMDLLDLARGLVGKTRRRGRRQKSASKVRFWKSYQDLFFAGRISRIGLFYQG
jgi:hypothetical protein